MIDNIQKLYEIAGVEKKYCGWLDMGDLDTQYEYVMCDTLKEYKEIAEFSRTSYSSDNENYMTPEIKHPPFTAEKQLELIKKVLEKGLLQLSRSSLGNIQFCNLGNAGDYKAEFDEALASFVINLWQGLSANQKQEIKEILK